MTESTRDAMHRAFAAAPSADVDFADVYARARRKSRRRRAIRLLPPAAAAVFILSIGAPILGDVLAERALLAEAVAYQTEQLFSDTSWELTVGTQTIEPESTDPWWLTPVGTSSY